MKENQITDSSLKRITKNNQLTEICNSGKVLYKQTYKAKLNDYTFTYLMNQVQAH